MATNRFITEAQATLPNGGLVRGRVMTSDDITYLFRNEVSDLDFYLYLRKGDQGWFQSGGPEIQWPQTMVDELGLYIDKFIIENPILNQTKLPD